MGHDPIQNILMTCCSIIFSSLAHSASTWYVLAVAISSTVRCALTLETFPGAQNVSKTKYFWLELFVQFAAKVHYVHKISISHE